MLIKIAKQYRKEERAEAVKLAQETSAKTASERLGINIDTIYTRISKAKKTAAEEAELASPEGRPGEAAGERTAGGAGRGGDPAGSIVFFRKAPEEVGARQRMEYVSGHRERWPVVRMCKVLGVSELGYYKHLRAQGRPDRDAEVMELIYGPLREDEENLNYGVRRIYEHLPRAPKILCKSE